MSSITANLAPSAAKYDSGTTGSRSRRRFGAAGDRASAAFPHTASLLDGATRDFFAGLWTPGLLDHLQEPLTRYHE